MQRGRLTRQMAAFAVGALLLTACDGDATPLVDPTGPEIGFEVSPSATESTDPWAAPDPLTEEYVRRVLTEIERARSQFFVWLYSSTDGEPPSDAAMEALEATYSAPLVDDLAASFIENWRSNDGARENVKIPPGQFMPVRVTLHRAEPACSLIEVMWDGSQVETDANPMPRSASIVVLAPQESSGTVNASGWVYKQILNRSDVSDEDIAEELAERKLCS